MLNISIAMFVIVLVILIAAIAFGAYFYIRSISSASCPPCPVPPPPSCPVITQKTQPPQQDPVSVRDRAALADPLYPPLNRQPRFAEEDTYRMVGYLVNPGDKDDAWKLFAREKRRGIGEFYVSSANKNIDVKIPLTNEVVAPPTKLRDVYDIPSEIRLNHPLFASNVTYQIIVNPQAELGSSAIYR